VCLVLLMNWLKSLQKRNQKNNLGSFYMRTIM
jgi:hypothetical protein